MTSAIPSQNVEPVTSEHPKNDTIEEPPFKNLEKGEVRKEQPIFLYELPFLFMHWQLVFAFSFLVFGVSKENSANHT